jgi:hypothetical protein
MRVIGAGLGRTGTKSLQAALEQLGFGPCYHMHELFAHPSHGPTWMAAIEGEPVDWAGFLRGYGSAVDFPSCSFYKELMVAFPDAKVLLSVRDPQRWYDSCLETIYEIVHSWPTPWFGRFIPKFAPVYRVSTELIWKEMFEGRFLDRDFAIRRFQQHTEEVIRHVPADRLLVFDVKQGWAPLCEFLGVPVPDTPFPHLNDTAEFKKGSRRLRIFQLAVLAALGGGLFFLGRRLLGRCARG